LALADNVGAELMLALQRATAATTVGFDASPAPAEALVVLVVLAVGAALLLELLELAGAALLLLLPLLLPPQPVTNAPPTATTATREQSLPFIDPPEG
jgi:hypothetical protein